jgi:hypothetical protein
MGRAPDRPKIYHITHGKNLGRILADGCLWSDAELFRRGGPDTAIGISEIKRRRLIERDVTCHPGTKVGEFVPFYFCPRSVMLYLIHKQNHPGLAYRGGQRPILHLEVDLHEVVAWAESQRLPWAFTDRNAGSVFFQAFRNPAELDRLNWEHIASVDFRNALVKEAKQAEFLVYRSFPWTLVRSIGVIDAGIARRVREILVDAGHQPDVQVERGWYY